jgi:hypothetical protein
MRVTKLPDRQLILSQIWPIKAKHELKHRLQILAHNDVFKKMQRTVEGDRHLIQVSMTIRTKDMGK